MKFDSVATREQKKYMDKYNIEYSKFVKKREASILITAFLDRNTDMSLSKDEIRALSLSDYDRANQLIREQRAKLANITHIKIGDIVECTTGFKGTVSQIYYSGNIRVKSSSGEIRKLQVSGVRVCDV